MRKRIFLCLSFLLLISGYASATTYYVNGSTGSNGYNGLYSTFQGGSDGPWATIAYAAANVPSGAAHTISVAAGTYNEGSITDSRSGQDSSNVRHWLASGTVTLNGQFSITGDYVTFDGFTVSNPSTVWNGTIYTNGDYVTIQNCTIPSSNSAGIYVWKPADHCTVHNNTISYCQLVGIRIDGTNHTISDNDVSHTIANASLYSDANGIELSSEYGDSSGHTVVGNYVHDILWAEQGGLTPHIDGLQSNCKDGGTSTVTNVTIEKNRFYLWQEASSAIDSSYSLMLSSPRSWTIKNNLFESWGGICTGNSGTVSDIHIYNNTFISNIDWVNNYDGAGISLRGGTSHEIKNNILVNYRQLSRGARHIQLTEGAQSSYVGANNLFWNSDGTSLYFIGYTPAASDIQQQDPQFVTNYSDLHLQSGSPCVDGGATIASVTEDYEETARPQSTDYDIGAYEYTSGLDTTAPEVNAATIGVNGATVTIEFTETVVTTGYDDGDFDLDCTSAGNGIALNSISGSGTTRTFTAATMVDSGDVCNLDYTGGADEIEDIAGNDLATFADTAVINNSTQNATTGHVISIPSGVGAATLQVGSGSSTMTVR